MISKSISFLVTMFVIVTTCAAHPAGHAGATVRIDHDGLFRIVARFDVLSFALNDSPHQVDTTSLNALLDGPADALRSALADSRQRMLRGVTIACDVGEASPRIVRAESIDYPTVDDVHRWRDAKVLPRLPVMQEATLSGSIPRQAKSIAIRFPEALDALVVTIEHPGEEAFAQRVEAGQSSTMLAVQLDRDGPTTAPTRITIEGKIVTIDVTQAPDLETWAREKLLPVCELWYPKIVTMLPSENYAAAERFTIEFHAKVQRGIPAYATGGRIVCNAEWFRKNLEGEARGAVVHEMVHVVQNYGQPERRNPPGEKNPGWMVEGVADYIRWFLYEPETRGAEIRDASKAKYDASYRVTGNFLNWVTTTYDKDIVRKMNAAMREGRYRDELWKEFTGKTVEELGAEWKASFKKKDEGSRMKDEKEG